MNMKQLYTVPFERNGERVKELRYQYVQRIMELEASEPPHSFLYMDEAGFNLTKRRRRGRNIIGHRATVDVPGQRGGNITMGCAISENGVLTHIPIIGPYNTERLVTFLDTLYRDLIPEQERGQIGDDLPKYVIVWDNVSFHRSNIIRQWFDLTNVHSSNLPPSHSLALQKDLTTDPPLLHLNPLSSLRLPALTSLLPARCLRPVHLLTAITSTHLATPCVLQ
ncbi:uncharacterized protein LOC122870620 [Siniperca chuatsi]|uniref:uncharacterized protein LOC122870620 n=1 Tax=Siniperca chuatsi TaxID=119488 RepID=UPI001CE10DF9|nr:uncharacterized protein LOC122870620 [Siniperca chuatsi]